MRSQFLKEVYERYAAELTLYLRKLTRAGADEADDIAHTAFLRLAARQTPEVIENPRAFLYTTARHLAIDGARHRIHLERIAGTQSARGAVAQTAWSAETDDLSPERILLGCEQLRLVEQAIMRLPPKRRRVFILSRVHQLSHAQIARETGLNVATVKQHIIRALADCRRAANELEAKEEP